MESVKSMTLEDVVREDIALFNSMVGKEQLKLERDTDADGDPCTYYHLLSHGWELWYGELWTINAIVKSFCKVEERPSRYYMTVRVY